MTTPEDIEECFTEACRDALDDYNIWIKEDTGVCTICKEELDEGAHFHFFRDINNELYMMDFHYECAILEDYVDEFKVTF